MFRVFMFQLELAIPGSWNKINPEPRIDNFLNHGISGILVRFFNLVLKYSLLSSSKEYFVIFYDRYWLMMANEYLVVGIGIDGLFYFLLKMSNLLKLAHDVFMNCSIEGKSSL